LLSNPIALWTYSKLQGSLEKIVDKLPKTPSNHQQNIDESATMQHTLDEI